MQDIPPLACHIFDVKEFIFPLTAIFTFFVMRMKHKFDAHPKTSTSKPSAFKDFSVSFVSVPSS